MLQYIFTLLICDELVGMIGVRTFLFTALGSITSHYSGHCFENASPRCVSYIPWQWMQQAAPICQHCTYALCHIPKDCNLHSPAPLWEPQISLLNFLSQFLFLNCLVIWEETVSTLYFNVTGVCLMCPNSLLSPSGRTIIKSWISNWLPCTTEKYVYVSCLLTVRCRATEHMLT